MFDLRAHLAPIGRRRKPDRHHRLLAARNPRAVIRFVVDELVKGNFLGREKEFSGARNRNTIPTAFSFVPIRAARPPSRLGSFVLEARGPADRAI